MAPSDVNAQNEKQVLRKLFPAIKRRRIKWKFTVGDTVRISQARQAFKKGYLPKWTEEIFVVKSRHGTNPPAYALKDYIGDTIAGKFYSEELQKVVKTDDSYKIEQIIKTRKRGGKTEYFVKWRGYPSKFNSWVDNITS